MQKPKHFQTWDFLQALLISLRATFFSTCTCFFAPQTPLCSSFLARSLSRGQNAYKQVWTLEEEEKAKLFVLLPLRSHSVRHPSKSDAKISAELGRWDALSVAQRCDICERKEERGRMHAFVAGDFGKGRWAYFLTDVNGIF